MEENVSVSERITDANGRLSQQVAPNGRNLRFINRNADSHIAKVFGSVIIVQNDELPISVIITNVNQF